jgi:hypothetical protein
MPTREDRFVRVSVRNSDFQPIRSIQTADEIQRFGTLWRTRREVRIPDNCVEGVSYKIDLEPGGRWIYHPWGIVSKLSYFEEPYYFIKDREAFNALLRVQSREKALPRVCVDALAGP